MKSKFKVKVKGYCKGLFAQQEGWFPFACFGNVLHSVIEPLLPLVIKPLAIKRLLKSSRSKLPLKTQTN